MVTDVKTLMDAGGNLLSSDGYLKETINHYFIKPNDETGIGSVKLDIIGEQTLSFDTDSTDNYVESNLAYQDQISLKPIIYTIQGEVGELVYYEKDSAQTQVGYVNEKLSKIASFAPSVSKSFQQISDKALKVAGWVDSADNLITRLSKLDFTENKQQQAYLALIALRNSRVPIDVATPWTNLASYVISNVKLTQPKETRDKTLIYISLKEFRTTELTYTKFNASNYQNRLANQKAQNIEQGQTNGKASDQSVLDFVIGGAR